MSDSLGTKLRRQGFDLATYVRTGPGTGYYRIRCSRCQALVVNGTATHERGCPNRPEVARSGIWNKT